MSTPLSTPTNCVADFCLIPIGTPTASVSKEVADVQRLMQKCGLEYTMHSAGTTVEGSWDDVMRVIGQAHTLLHDQGIVRIQTDIRVGSRYAPRVKGVHQDAAEWRVMRRTDKMQTFNDKVATVRGLLAKDHES